MGDTWILSHGCSSPVWISLILYTEIKTRHLLTYTPKAETILWQQHWPGSSCQLVTATPVSFQHMQLWPGLHVALLHGDFLVQQSFMTIKWLLSCLCFHTPLIWIKMIYTVRILNIISRFLMKIQRHCCCSLWDLSINTCIKVSDFKIRQLSIMLW